MKKAQRSQSEHQLRSQVKHVCQNAQQLTSQLLRNEEEKKENIAVTRLTSKKKFLTLDNYKIHKVHVHIVPVTSTATEAAHTGG